MKSLTEKILKSGLIDKHTAQIMERWGQLPEGASDIVQENALENATKEQLARLAEEIAEEVETESRIKETSLDLNTLRWPKTVRRIVRPNREAGALSTVGSIIAYDLSAVVDRMGRFYFRAQDVIKEWFVPGFVIEHDIAGKPVSNEILEVTELFVGETIVAIQVSVR